MAADPKPEEISHPPMDQLQGLEYCIDSNPSWGMSISLLLLVFFFFETSSLFSSFQSLFPNLVFMEAGEAIGLGFQHYILALGTAVMIPSFLVPLMGGNHVSQFTLPLPPDFSISSDNALAIWPERRCQFFVLQVD